MVAQLRIRTLTLKQIINNLVWLYYMLLFLQKKLILHFHIESASIYCNNSVLKCSHWIANRKVWLMLKETVHFKTIQWIDSSCNVFFILKCPEADSKLICVVKRLSFIILCMYLSFFVVFLCACEIFLAMTQAH